MKKIKGLLIIIVLWSQLGLAQQAQIKWPLTKIMSDLELKHEVKFSYAVKDVKGIELEPPEKDFTLNQSLDYLNASTLLNFEILDERYITVTSLNKSISICGFIKENSVLALPGASVLVENSTRGAITDINGKFILEDIPANSRLVITYVGFKTEILKASLFFSTTDSCKTIILDEEIEALNEVVITKYLTRGLQKLLDGSTVLNTDKFGILPGLIEPDVLQSIQVLPGIESTNESIANINVRGGTNDQNLMLWDGIKMYHSGHFFGLISAYNPHLTNKVVVIKNGTSSAYSDGVSSTIDMSTKDEINDKTSGGAGFNLISADAFLEIPISSQLAIHLSGRRSFTDAFNSPTYDNYFERSFQDSDISTNSDLEQGSSESDFWFYDYSAKLLYDINDDHRFRANVIGIKNNLEYSESYNTMTGDSITKSSRLVQENIGAGAQWHAQWSSKFKSELSGYYSKYNVDAFDRRVQTNQNLTQANEVLDTGVKINTFFNITEDLSLLNGYQFNETGILNETTVSAPSYERTKKDVLLNHAFFSEIEYHKNRTYARAGVRVNYFQKFQKLLIEPRLNIRQKLSNSFAVEIQGEFKNQSATQIVDFQDDFLGVENRRWILANEQDIPISTSKQLSLGAAYSHRNMNVNITGFYKKVEGITASNQGFYNDFQYINASGNYLAQGIEFLANITTNKLSTWISYTTSTNDYEFENLTPSSFPNNVDIRHSVSFAINYNIIKQLEISVGGIWRTGHPYSQPVPGNETVQNGGVTIVNYDTPNKERLPDFIRLDASLHYQFDFSPQIKASLRAGVINLTNESNIINRYYEVDPNDMDSTIQINNKSLELTPNVSFRVKF